MLSQVRFNRVPEKVPEKVPGGFGAEPGEVQQGSEKVPEKVAEKVPEEVLRKTCKIKRCDSWGYHRSLFFPFYGNG